MGLIFQSIKDKFSGVSKDDRLKVQGISLGESIDTFEAQLQARGWVKGSDLPKSMNLVAKLYNGKFNGKKADLIIYYNIVLRNIQFVAISYERTTENEATRQNQENIDKVIETYGIRPQKYPIGFVFQLKHGRIVCKVEYDDNGRYAAAIVYTNNPNNESYVERGYSEF